MHSHHSHSGQYVQHAKDSLEDVVKQAIDKGFTVYCLTEHMPRYRAQDLYPEELETQTTVEALKDTFDRYYHHAKELQERYKDRITLLVGFETELIHGQEDYDRIVSLRNRYHFDMIVGSIHHVAKIPIDFDQETWNEALRKVSPDFQRESDLFAEYFDLQYEMLKQIKPQVIGHFDLIRLFASKESSNDISKLWPEVWSKITRNIDYAISIGLYFELNSAAVRKGWDTPYPRPDIAKYIQANNGRFCLSDDSHGISQVGLNYHKSIQYLKSLGVERLWYLDLENGSTVKKSIQVSMLS